MRSSRMPRRIAVSGTTPRHRRRHHRYTRLGRAALAALMLSACADLEDPVEPNLAKGGGKGPTISEAIPDSAEQDTTLNVRVRGNGFDNGSKVGFLKNDLPAEGLTVNSTQFVSSEELIANVTIAAEAVIATYDVEVTTRRGKKGIGSELFSVVQKGGGNPKEAEPVDTAYVQLSLGYPAVFTDGNAPDGDIHTWMSRHVVLTDPLIVGLPKLDLSIVAAEVGTCIDPISSGQLELSRDEDGSGVLTFGFPSYDVAGEAEHLLTLRGGTWQGGWPATKGTRASFLATDWELTSHSGKGPKRCEGSGTFANPPLVELWTMDQPPALLPTSPFLSRPFSGEYSARLLFDHDDTEPVAPWTCWNCQTQTYWGERVQGSEVHGYTWLMPAGTPVLAAASGTVDFVSSLAPVYCSDGSIAPAHRVVGIEHVAPSGQRLITAYHYFDAIDVVPGQSVVAGQQIGLSGRRECNVNWTTLAFAVRLVSPDGEDYPSRTYGRTDPYGWSGAGPDPYPDNPRGLNSAWLWLPGEAPAIYREHLRPLGADPIVTLTRWRWMGVRDGQNLNNEFIELSLTPGAGTSLDLTGFTLLNEADEVIALPAGTTLNAGTPLRVYSGAGLSTASDVYLGRLSPAWDNISGCAELYDSQGVLASRTCLIYNPYTSNAP